MPSETVRSQRRVEPGTQGERNMELQGAEQRVSGREDLNRNEQGERLKLERGSDGQLWARYRGRHQAVCVTRCFPWSEPGRFISLRDDEEEEFALVRDPADLDEGSRAALEMSLVESGFVLEIIGVDVCEEEVEIRTWVVRTKQGLRSFQTRRDGSVESARVLGGVDL